jgi:oleate hydratase
LFPDLWDMSHIMRTPVNQYQFFIEPMVAWLRGRGVAFLTGTLVRDIGFVTLDGRITVNRIDYERDNVVTSVAVRRDDLVLLTTGSQVADVSVGSMTEVPRPRRSGRSWALWERIAQERKGFGNPNLFFGERQYRPRAG